ncbi:Crp/Fnr family transcriptional regulator [Rhizosphaericola mali]|uniref:Crp/Fnr family transcriptional regulator n=1 Tax=Rhizosphaericola mali TaxID=2545455 RepID=A0A5P2G5I5_9BACT|nr:Crp/Fnr family transcriptional regulator [Rhizosphaericola mali]QES89938.1 Crp/Fnr family transcriptional regulator [Rhizosphaericola mali]
MFDFTDSLKAHFPYVEKEELEIIQSLFSFEKYAKNSFYLKEKRRCEKLSFIQTGLIRIFKQTDNKEITQWICTEGHLVSEIGSFLFDYDSRWSFQFLTDSELFTIQKTDYNRLIEKIPRWHFIEKQLLAQCFLTMENRIFKQLALSAEERYQDFFQDNSELFNQVPLQYLASMLGMTPETFSRIRKKSLH